MTKAEFLKRLEDEKLFYKDKHIVVDKGLVDNIYHGEIFSCTFVSANRLYYIFETEAVYSDREVQPEPTYITYTDKKGREKKLPVSCDIDIKKTFTTEDEAFTEFYNMIKFEMLMEEEDSTD